jgi:Tfp pilus assembly protein FimV
MAIAPWGAKALEVGTLHWKPVPGQAPVAEIELSDKSPIEPGAIRVSIATREAYGVAGLTYHPGLADAQISAQTGAGGRTVLRLVHMPLNTPDLDLLLVVSNRAQLFVAEYRIKPQSGAYDVPFSPVGTHQAALLPTHTKMEASKPLRGAKPLPANDATAAARDAVIAWAQAWSQRDVAAYIGAYTADFTGTPAKGTHSSWVEQRRTRILARKRISVELADLQLVRQGDTVTATFEQRYRSDGPVDRLRKRLVLVPVNGRWLIQFEVALN